jgi:hypothetical protein
VSKKPHKVAEPQAPYPAKKPAKVAVPVAGKAGDKSAEFQRIAGKIFSERKELLRKLAQ